MQIVILITHCFTFSTSVFTNTGEFLTFLLACLIWSKVRLLQQNLNSFISTKKKKKCFIDTFIPNVSSQFFNLDTFSVL